MTKKDSLKPRELTNVDSLSNADQERIILILNPDDIVVEEQVRKEFKDIEELAASMLVAQLQPIVVSPLDETTGKYLLQKGERRLRAARMNGPEFKIKAIVDSTKRTQSEATASQLQENIQRQDLSPIEIGKALIAMRDAIRREGGKGTGKELALRNNKTEAWVSKHIGLADLPSELANIFESVTTDSEIIIALKQMYDLHPPIYAQQLKKAKSENGLSREEARYWVKVAKGRDTGARRSIKQLVVATEGTPSSDFSGEDTSLMLLNDVGHATTSHAIPSESQPNSKQNTSSKRRWQATKSTKNGMLCNSKIYSIEAEQMVINIRISFDKNQVNGELLLNKVCGDASKGIVSYRDGGKQIEKAVELDRIEILSINPLPPHN